MRTVVHEGGDGDASSCPRDPPDHPADHQPREKEEPAPREGRDAESFHGPGSTNKLAVALPKPKAEASSSGHDSSQELNGMVA